MTITMIYENDDRVKNKGIFVQAAGNGEWPLNWNPGDFRGWD